MEFGVTGTSGPPVPVAATLIRIPVIPPLAGGLIVQALPQNLNPAERSMELGAAGVRGAPVPTAADLIRVPVIPPLAAGLLVQALPQNLNPAERLMEAGAGASGLPVPLPVANNPTR